eukprot:135316-Pelagomonas_calceolata.AAC.2
MAWACAEQQALHCSAQGQRQEAGLSAWGLAVEWLGGAACVHRAREYGKTGVYPQLTLTNSTLARRENVWASY